MLRFREHVPPRPHHPGGKIVMQCRTSGLGRQNQKKIRPWAKGKKSCIYDRLIYSVTVIVCIDVHEKLGQEDPYS
jgi:hypothetical protein